MAAVLVLCAISAPAHAEDTQLRRPLLLMTAGCVADLWSTKAVLDSGGHESYPFMRDAGFGQIVAQRIAGTVAWAVAMRTLEKHGHPRLAKTIGYVNVGLLFGATVHNVTQVKP